MKKIILTLSLFLMIGCSGVFAEDYTVFSPNKRIKVVVSSHDDLQFSVFYQDKAVLVPSSIALTLADDIVLGKYPQVVEARTTSVNEKILVPIKTKRDSMTNHYQQLELRFKQNFGVVFRVFDDGLAYRFTTAFNDSIIIYNEKADLLLAQDDSIFFPQVNCNQYNNPDLDCFHSSFEELYQRVKVSALESDQLGFLPVLINSDSNPKLLITESNLEDYPGMFLTGSSTHQPLLKAKFAPYPTREKTFSEYPQDLVLSRADYIAKTKGTRTFPWRVLVMVEEDGQLIETDIVNRLADPPILSDYSWIKPGKSTSEWIIDNNIYGVDFRSGYNTDTYKYYIDFAAKFGLEYVLFDAGWSNPADIFSITPGMDMDFLIQYAQQKGVGVVLWTSSSTLNRQMIAALDKFQAWGIKGLMVDFMDRDDQPTVQFYYRVAEEAAKRQLFIDFHGSYKPTGLIHTYPNVLTQEGARGQEYFKFTDNTSAEYEATLPFVRMVAGPYDYEPGNMRNETRENFRPMSNKPTAMGTRIHQMTMFIVYESPYSKMGGNPSDFLREPEYAAFMAQIPTVWNETKALKAKIADYAVVLRTAENGDFYIGALNDWTARDIDLIADFLPDATAVYTMEIYQDGINADRYASDYKRVVRTISKNDRIQFHLAPGGGWVAKISITKD